MSAETVIALVVSALLTVYLFIALIVPEKLG
jgi:K+-transporting ATPase KdpF subunit